MADANDRWTKTGKALVIANVIFSVFFLALSVLAYSTRLDLQKEVAQRKSERSSQESVKTKRAAEVAQLKADLKKVQDEAANSRTDNEKNKSKDEGEREKLRADVKQTTEKARKEQDVAQVAAVKQQQLVKTVEQKRQERADIQKKEDEKSRQKADLLNRLAQKLNEADTARQINEGLEQQLREIEGK